MVAFATTNFEPCIEDKALTCTEPSFQFSNTGEVALKCTELNFEV